jgi:cytosine/adenosine deaminase-related metal-dependent hydrolase
MILVVGWLAGCDSSPADPPPAERRIAAPMALPPPVQLHRHKDHVPYEEQFPPSDVQPPEDEARKTEIFNRLAEIRQRFEERQKDGN